MKRSNSFLDINSPKELKRQIDCNSFIQNSTDSRSPKLIQSKNIMKLDPVPSSSRSLKKVSCKIHTSDFWTPLMKLKLQKLSEVRLNECEKVKIKKNPIQESRFLDHKYKRTRGDKVLNDTEKFDAESLNENTSDRKIKSNTCKNLASLDKIIEECEEERGSNKKLCKDIFLKRKVMLDEVRKIKNSIKSPRF